MRGVVIWCSGLGFFMLRRKLRIWLALVPAMVVPFAASLFYFVIFSDCCSARVIYGGAKAFTIVWPIVAVYLILRTTLPKIEIGLKKHRRAIPSCVLLGIAIVILMFVLMRTPVGEVVVSNSDRIEGKAQELGILRHYWLFALLLSVVHSLIEEYYWRWFVFGQLKTVVNVYGAHLLAGVSFAAHHTVIATQLLPLFWGFVLGGLAGAGGIIWSVMYDKQKTIAGVWICHLIIDLGIMAIGHKILFGSYIMGTVG